MDWGPTIAFGALAFALISAVVTAAIKFQRVEDNSAKNDEAIQDIHRRKAIMNNHIEEVTKALADFRYYVAANFAPLSALEKMEARIMGSLTEIAKRLERKGD